MSLSQKDKCCSKVYYCPISKDFECPKHSGFNVCCDKPNWHQKHSDQEYIDCQFYEIQNEVEYVSKVTLARKDFECVNCGKVVKAKTRYFNETCIIPGEGRRRSKTCLKCLDKWIDWCKPKVNAK